MRQSALGLGALVLLAALGCAQEQTPPRLPADPQIIAIVTTSGTVVPIARHAGGVWDRPPWATPAELTRFQATSDGDGDWRWPDARRLWPGLPAMGMGIHPYIGGVALSRAPSAVLSAADIPGLERIEEDLGLVDVTDQGKLNRRFDWLGFFRYDDFVLGVVQARYYESSSLSIVEIDGELGRVVARASEGGC